MKLTDMVPIAKWREFENKVHQRSGLDISVFNLDGVQITDNRNWANRLCPVIKANKNGQTFVCAMANSNISRMAINSGKTVIEECDAGLIKMAVPISVNGEFQGTVGGCGLLLEDGEIDVFHLHKTTDIEEDAIDRLANDIGIMTQNEAEFIASSITERINQVSSEFEKRQQ